MGGNSIIGGMQIEPCHISWVEDLMISFEVWRVSFFLSAIQGVPVSKFGGFSLVVPAQQSVAKVSVVDQFMKKKESSLRSSPT